MQTKNSITLRNILFSILSGLILTASFPPGKLEWMVWFAIIPLLISIEGKSRFDAFRIGILTGIVHYLTLIFWLVFVMNYYGGLNLPTGIGILILFSFYLALFPGLFSLIVSSVHGTRFSILFTSGIWVALEYLRAKLFSGFPWCLLGYSQFKNLNLIQVSDLVGVYGISFLIISANVLIYLILLNRNLFKKNRFLKYETAIIFILFLMTMAYGYKQLSGSKRQDSKETVNVAIVQGNIDQAVKWDPVFKEKTLNIYKNLSEDAYDFNPHLIVWPETSVPLYFQEGGKMTHRVRDIAKKSRASLIFGSPAYSREKGLIKYYNRAYEISPEGIITGYYDKVHLVPFGEYVPFQKYLPFVSRLAQAAGDFVSGNEIQPLNSRGISSGILICFEVIFPELARIQTKNGADIIVNLTNDAWFGMTSAPYQHLGMVVFRAVENKRPLVRSANTGFSAFISPMGEISRISDLFMPKVLKQEVILDSSYLTFYTRYGDIFAIIISIISLIYVIYILSYHKLKEKKDESRDDN